MRGPRSVVRIRRAVCMLPALLLLGVAPEDPVHVVVYGDHTPAFFAPNSWEPYGTVPFTSPFCEVDLLAFCSFPGNTYTRLRLTEVPGIRVPRGSAPWGHTAWSKYVLIGNYSETNSSVGQSVAGQSIGVYDTEARTFCEIDLVPEEAATNAAVQFVAVASPQATQTRIYFAGITHGPGYSFGYLEANTTNPSPCDPETGWNVVGFTRQQLNCAAAELPPDCQESELPPALALPCEGVCGWDDMTRLDAETVVLGNWLESSFVAVKVDANGVLSVPDVYPLPNWQPGGSSGDACFTVRPVSHSAADPTRSAGDLRWATSMDVSCDNEDVPATCADYVEICPLAPAGQNPPDLACPPSGQCAQKHCEKPFGLAKSATHIPCTTAAECAPFGVDLGACVDSCVTAHPAQRCAGSVRSGEVCNLHQQCGTGQNCVCNNPGIPTQEYSFDGATISAKSRFFQRAEGKDGLRATYDSGGTLWLADGPQDQTATVAKIHRYYSVFGYHSYDDTSDPGGSAVVPPNDSSLQIQGWNWLQWPVEAVQAPPFMYLSTRSSLQRARAGYGVWQMDASFDLSLGALRLPSEGRHCQPVSIPGQFPFAKGCIADSECQSWQDCLPSEQVARATIQGKHTPSVGGSPPSLWSVAGFVRGAADPSAVRNVYLLRLPHATPVPDSVVSRRPAIAWNGGDCASHPRQCRLWAVAMKDGAMRFRVRDDGFWSSWSALPAASVGLGPAIVATGNAVEVYARASDRTVMRTQLTSSVQCEPAACTWSAWQTLPGSPWTDDDVAAAAGGGKKLVAMRRAYDGLVHVTVDSGSGWSPWIALPGLPVGQAPSVAYHPADGRFWFAASKYIEQTLYATKFDGTTPEPWSAIPSPGLTWHTAPAIASDGQRIHVYAARTSSPAPLLQHVIHNGAGFGAWRELVSKATSGWQPAAANANGEVQLIGTWPGSGMSEQATD